MDPFWKQFAHGFDDLNEDVQDEVLARLHPHISTLANHAIREIGRGRADHDDALSEFWVRFIVHMKGSKHPRWETLDEFLDYAQHIVYPIVAKIIRSQSAHSRDVSRVFSYDAAHEEFGFEIIAPDDRRTAELHQVLSRMEENEPRMWKVVELIHFSELSTSQAASILGVSASTVRRNWRKARDWLANELGASSKNQAAPKASPLVVQMAPFSDRLYEWLLEDPERLFSISDEDFERMVADRFSAMGFGVQRVGATNRKDGGIDIVAWPQTSQNFPFLVAAQVKHHRRKRTTPILDVRDFHGVLTAQGSHFHFGVIVTNTSFTPDAKWFATKNARLLRLRDLVDLSRWMRNDFGGEQEWREIPAEIELAPGVTIAIPKRRLWVPPNVM